MILQSLARWQIGDRQKGASAIQAQVFPSSSSSKNVTYDEEYVN